MKVIYCFFILVFLVIGYSSCTKRNYEKLHPVAATDSTSTPIAVCDTSGVISYSANIVPALVNNCNISACHSTSSPGGGYDFSNYNGVFNCAASGKLLSCVVWDGNASQMPSGASHRISSCDIAKIRNWLSGGALNN